MLLASTVDTNNVDFLICPNDDFWVRDNGPIYVHDNLGNLGIQDWGFNGWGDKADYQKCDAVPAAIAEAQNRTLINLNTELINEGGSVEMDGNGTLMACKSPILNKNRNPGLNQGDVEAIFTKYLGVTNFVWLKGIAGLEITDQHIDGFTRFGNSNTIVTMSEDDLFNYDVCNRDIKRLYAATNKVGEPYDLLQLPLTRNNVITTYGEDLGYKGSYVNYYIANTKVIVPTYDDPNDTEAISIVQGLYPDRTVVGVDFRDVYANGGMTHCVTQQQPAE